MKLLCVVVLFALFAVSLGAVRPKIPLTYYTNITSQFLKSSIGSFQEFYASDDIADTYLETHMFAADFVTRDLDRYDLQHTYYVRDVAGTSTCSVYNTSGNVAAEWFWFVPYVTYAGQQNNSDIWKYTFSGDNYTLGVSLTDASRPLFLYFEYPGEISFQKFDSWSTTRPLSQWFDVPVSCGQTPAPVKHKASKALRHHQIQQAALSRTRENRFRAQQLHH